MANPRPIQAIPEETPFHPHDALKSGIKGAILGGSAGFVVAAVQNSLAKTNVGAWGVFSRGGGTIAMFTAVTSVYTFSKDASANLREKNDTWNTTIASFFSGATIGLRTGRVPQILGIGAFFSVVMSTFEYTGGTLRGRRRTENPEMDDYEYKESLRLTRRRPIEETLANVGEGRGIQPPFYEERRRERLKEKYGVDINPVRADGS